MRIIAAMALAIQMLPTALWAAEPPAAPPITYTLENLKPVAFSQYVSSVSARQYLQLQNEAGTHYIVYDETITASPLKEVTNLRPFLASTDFTCNAEIECKMKAFCTGECRNMYYEMTNAPADPLYTERSNCTIRNFSCEKSVITPAAVVPAASTPIAATPPLAAQGTP